MNWPLTWLCKSSYTSRIGVKSVCHHAKMEANLNILFSCSRNCKLLAYVCSTLSFSFVWGMWVCKWNKYILVDVVWLCVREWWWVGSLHMCWSYEVIVNLSLAWGFVAPFKIARKYLLLQNLIPTLHKCWSYKVVVNLSLAWGFLVPFLIAIKDLLLENPIPTLHKCWSYEVVVNLSLAWGFLVPFIIAKKDPLLEKPNTNLITF